MINNFVPFIMFALVVIEGEMEKNRIQDKLISLFSL